MQYSLPRYARHDGRGDQYLSKVCFSWRVRSKNASFGSGHAHNLLYIMLATSLDDGSDSNQLTTTTTTTWEKSWYFICLSLLKWYFLQLIDADKENGQAYKFLGKQHLSTADRPTTSSHHGSSHHSRLRREWVLSTTDIYRTIINCIYALAASPQLQGPVFMMRPSQASVDYLCNARTPARYLQAGLKMDSQICCKTQVSVY